MAKARRKFIRLEPDCYKNPANIFNLTICTWNRIPLFNNVIYAETLTDTLHNGLFARQTKLYAYCLMPDHLHLLVSPNEANLPDLISRWKSYTSNQLRSKGMVSRCWQRSFYDHVLRKDEEIETTAAYIIHNPIRAGLVRDWQDYAHSWHMWM